jgi:hypothetical protein
MTLILTLDRWAHHSSSRQSQCGLIKTTFLTKICHVCLDFWNDVPCFACAYKISSCRSNGCQNLTQRSFSIWKIQLMLSMSSSVAESDFRFSPLELYNPKWPVIAWFTFLNHYSLMSCICDSCHQPPFTWNSRGIFGRPIQFLAKIEELDIDRIIF